MTPFLEVLGALLPPVGVGLLFWYVMRAIIHADRRERIALARLEAQDSAAARGENTTDGDEK